jgi:hypothetical protein
MHRPHSAAQKHSFLLLVLIYVYWKKFITKFRPELLTLLGQVTTDSSTVFYLSTRQMIKIVIVAISSGTDVHIRFEKQKENT